MMPLRTKCSLMPSCFAISRFLRPGYQLNYALLARAGPAILRPTTYPSLHDSTLAAERDVGNRGMWGHSDCSRVRPESSPNEGRHGSATPPLPIMDQPGLALEDQQSFKFCCNGLQLLRVLFVSEDFDKGANTLFVLESQHSASIRAAFGGTGRGCVENKPNRSLNGSTTQQAQL